MLEKAYALHTDMGEVLPRLKNKFPTDYMDCVERYLIIAYRGYARVHSKDDTSRGKLYFIDHVDANRLLESLTTTFPSTVSIPTKNDLLALIQSCCREQWPQIPVKKKAKNY